jgi:site-specific DNA-methyltransferase (adenine-specific)
MVLDNTAGSGTLGVACLNTNRDFILIEKNPEDFEKIKNRIVGILKNYGLDPPILIN